MDPKKLAQQIAKQVAQESIEVLKTAKEQVVGNEQIEKREEDKPVNNSQAQLQDKMKSSRRMEAYQRELDEIRKQNIFKDLQEKITQGVEIPLEDYPELSMEQKQVLKAQMEAVKTQMLNDKYANDKSLEIPGSKRGRQMGQKQEAEKQQTRVEKPVPPSG